MSLASYDTLRQDDPSWDYRGAFTKSLSHGFHSYPAMMIPQVARRLIETYSKPGDIVLDPFCGSGSVLVEAKVLGRNSWGIDLNPVALLLARAKTRPIDPRRLTDAFLHLCRRVDACRPEDVALPVFFNLDYWFKPAVALQLARIKQAIDSVSEPADLVLKEFFLVSFSETVRLSSNSRSREFKLFRHAGEKLACHNPDAIEIFIEKTRRNIAAMAALYDACGELDGDHWCRLMLADATQGLAAIDAASVDLVVTSPPYGDSRTTVAYGQFSRLSAQWLGLDDAQARALDGFLLGGRLRSTRSLALSSPSLERVLDEIGRADVTRARQVLQFYEDLSLALAGVARTVRSGGRLCIVIGNRTVKKVLLPTDLIICEMAASLGLLPERIWIRNIPSKTMPLKNSPTNVAGAPEPTMHREHIVLLRR